MEQTAVRLPDQISQEIEVVAGYEVVVKDAPTYEAAAARLKDIKGLEKSIKDYFALLKGMAHASWKGLCQRETEELDKLAPVEKALKLALSAYTTEQERKAREEERRLQAEADKKRVDEEAARNAVALKEHMAGNTEKAMETLSKPVEPVSAPVVQREVPKVQGIKTRLAWHFEIMDASRLPRELLIPDTATIGKIVQQRKGETKIPGVRVWSTQEIAAGRG